VSSQHRNPEDVPIAALLVPDILALLDESPGDISAETEELHPRDLADVVELLPEDRVRELLLALPGDRAADVLEYLDEDLRTDIIEAMSAREAAQLVSQMNPDDRADTLEDLDEERAEEILAEIPAEARRETERLLAFEPESAGGLMTTEFVSVASTMPVEEALEGVRVMARTGRREAMYAIYATDTQGRITGVLSLRELLAAVPGTSIGDVAWTEVRSVSPSADREEVSRMLSDYDLVAVPVVSESGHIMGVITFDDVIDAIQEEQTEDVQKFGGMEALDESYLQSNVVAAVKKRAGWLIVLFMGSLLTATVIDHFQAALTIALISFIPLIISSGGNSGSQATSLVIRAMALGELELRDWWMVARRELSSGLLLGIILGVLSVGRVALWHHTGWDGGQYGAEYLRIGMTIGAAILGVVTFGSFVGAMLPFLLRRVGFDPASASAPFVATLVDVMGLIIYFLAAAAILGPVLTP
jgi:magnesium transporter